MQQQQQQPAHLQQQTPQLGQSAIVTPNVTPVVPQAVSSLPTPQPPQQQHQQTPTGIIQQQSPPQPQTSTQTIECDKLDSVSPVSGISGGVAVAQISDSEQNDPKYASQNQEPKTFAHLLKAGGAIGGGGNTPSPVPQNLPPPQQQQQPQQQAQLIGGVGSGSTPQSYPGQYNRGGDNGQQGMPQRTNSIRNKDNNKNGKF